MPPKKRLNPRDYKTPEAFVEASMRLGEERFGTMKESAVLKEALKAAYYEKWCFSQPMIRGIFQHVSKDNITVKMIYQGRLAEKQPLWLTPVLKGVVLQKKRQNLFLRLKQSLNRLFNTRS